MLSVMVGQWKGLAWIWLSENLMRLKCKGSWQKKKVFQSPKINILQVKKGALDLVLGFNLKSPEILGRKGRWRQDGSRGKNGPEETKMVPLGPQERTQIFSLSKTNVYILEALDVVYLPEMIF